MNNNNYLLKKLFFSSNRVYRAEPSSGSRSKARLSSGLADPVVLVDPRPGEGERGSIGLEAFLAGRELGGRASGWRRKRRECVPSGGLPLLPEPCLRGAGRELAELWTTGADGQRESSTDGPFFENTVLQTPSAQLRPARPTFTCRAGLQPGPRRQFWVRARLKT